MNETTAWYLGLRGEKTAYQPGRGGYGRQQQQPWYTTPYGMVGAGAGTAIAGQGLRRAGDIAEGVEGVHRSLEATGKVPKGVGSAEKAYLEKAHKRNPQATGYARRGAGGIKRVSKGVGKAGLLGGLGLAGYGAYKSMTE